MNRTFHALRWPCIPLSNQRPFKSLHTNNSSGENWIDCLLPPISQFVSHGRLVSDLVRCGSCDEWWESSSRVECPHLYLTGINKQHSPTVLSTATHYILLDWTRCRLISSLVEADISTSLFNQYFIKLLQGAKYSLYLSLEDLSIVLPCVFFFALLCPRTNLSHIVTSTCMHTNVML